MQSISDPRKRESNNFWDSLNADHYTDPSHTLIRNSGSFPISSLVEGEGQRTFSINERVMRSVVGVCLIVGPQNLTALVEIFMVDRLSTSDPRRRFPSTNFGSLYVILCMQRQNLA